MHRGDQNSKVVNRVIRKAVDVITCGVSTPEIYAHVGLCFQISFKNLDIDMKEVTPSSLLKNRVTIVEGNPDFSNNNFRSYIKQKDKVNSNSTVRSVVNQVKSPIVAAGPSDQAGHTHMPPAAAGASYQSHVLHQNADQLHLPTDMLGEDEKKAALGSPNQLPPAQGPKVAQFPHTIPSRPPIIPDLELSRLNMFFRSVLLMAMEMALEELVSGFVKRSDYSSELDNDYILSASCMMASRLAGELSYVTSKVSYRAQVGNDRSLKAYQVVAISSVLCCTHYNGIDKWRTFLSAPLYRKDDRTSRALLPPGPYGLPVVGYLPFLSSNLHERFTEMAHRYGPIFSLRLGSKLHIVVNSVDLSKVVVRDLDQTFANRRSTLTALAISYGGNSIVWSNKTYWRNLRKLLVSQFLSSTNLNKCQRFRKYEVRKMVTEVYSRIGTKIGIKKTVFNTELNVVTSMLWGFTKSGEEKDLSYTRDEFRDIVFKIIELLGAPNISDFIPLLSRLDVQGKQRQMKKQRENLDRIFDSIIKRRIEAISKETKGAVEEDGRKDFLSMLLDPNESQDATTSLNIDQLKALLIDIVVGGTDTTSTMVEWVMAEILHNPSVMRKVQDELTTVIGMSIVEESHIPKLTYLDAVIKETFRLHPPLPLLI
ncbi:cytochrome P450 [Artemisia annua]|uniref:Cytochrome P450 n=1 Tax=Artemisia annua TaxID=35608 RepID=A0A2U1LFF3_ARTAN|nr:cytochrome P450 [Artemisia annua]